VPAGCRRPPAAAAAGRRVGAVHRNRAREHQPGRRMAARGAPAPAARRAARGCCPGWSACPGRNPVRIRRTPPRPGGTRRRRARRAAHRTGSARVPVRTCTRGSATAGRRRGRTWSASTRRSSRRAAGQLPARQQRARQRAPTKAAAAGDQDFMGTSMSPQLGAPACALQRRVKDARHRQESGLVPQRGGPGLQRRELDQVDAAPRRPVPHRGNRRCRRWVDGPLPARTCRGSGSRPAGRRAGAAPHGPPFAGTAARSAGCRRPEVQPGGRYRAREVVGRGQPQRDAPAGGARRRGTSGRCGS
jgi:hypothetical protein